MTDRCNNCNVSLFDEDYLIREDNGYGMQLTCQLCNDWIHGHMDVSTVIEKMRKYAKENEENLKQLNLIERGYMK